MPPGIFNGCGGGRWKVLQYGWDGCIFSNFLIRVLLILKSAQTGRSATGIMTSNTLDFEREIRHFPCLR